MSVSNLAYLKNAFRGEIMQKKIGRHHARDVIEAVLEYGSHRVHLLNFGSVVRRWVFDGRDVVLGFDNFEDYLTHSRSFGILAGRVANRTCHGRFELGGREHQVSINNGPHHLHGGCTGLGERLWDMDVDTLGNRVRLRYFSPHNEEGYPGNVQFTATWSLDAHGLHCKMQGVPDEPTPINLAQHSYYNLDAHTPDIDTNRKFDIRSHQLFVDADYYLPVDSELIPTGELLPVAGTRFDFRSLTSIEQRDRACQGHDHNLVLRADRDTEKPAARLVSGDGSIALSLTTQEPGIQLYSAAALSVPKNGIEGRPFVPYGGICLEAQHFPDSLNRPDFPSIIRGPEHPYEQNLSVQLDHM